MVTALIVQTSNLLWTSNTKNIPFPSSYQFSPGPSGAASFFLTTPTSTGGQVTSGSELNESSSRENTRAWLEMNRFSQYLSLFANYTGADLLRLSRRDLLDLCGTADGIRLYNTLRIRMVKILYICMEQEKGMKLFQFQSYELLFSTSYFSVPGSLSGAANSWPPVE